MPRPTSPVISTDNAEAPTELAAEQDAKRKKHEPADDSDDSGIVGDVVETAINVITDLLGDS